jgi:coenzyme F420-reducing hydrogenase alpha subunit
MDADPARRNIFGVMQVNPELARDGIRIRQFGQEIIESLAGKRIHPAWVVPGGVSRRSRLSGASKSSHASPKHSRSCSAR